MKLRFERIGRDHLGNPLLPELRGNRRQVVLNIIKMLDDNPKNGVQGYRSMSQLQAFLMLEYWKRFDGMPEVMNHEQFQRWFVHEKGIVEGKATFPDYIRRAVEWLVSEELVDIDPVVKRDAKNKAKYLQSSFSGVQG